MSIILIVEEKKWNQSLYEFCFDLLLGLPHGLQRKIFRTKNKSLKEARIFSWGLLAHLLPDIQNIAYTKYGKPYCKNSYYFNLSHYKGNVVIGISNMRIGIDWEGKEIPNSDTYRNYFSKHFPGIEQLAMFYEADGLTKFWNAYESIYKYHGQPVDSAYVVELIKQTQDFPKFGINQTHFDIALKQVEMENGYISICSNDEVYQFSSIVSIEDVLKLERLE